MDTSVRKPDSSTSSTKVDPPEQVSEDSRHITCHGYSVSIKGKVPHDLVESITVAHVKALAWMSVQSQTQEAG